MAVAQQLEAAIRQVGFIVQVETSGSTREKVGQRFDQSTETIDVWMSLIEQEQGGAGLDRSRNPASITGTADTIQLNMSGANEYKPQQGDIVIHNEGRYKIASFKTNQLGNEITDYEITGVA